MKNSRLFAALFLALAVVGFPPAHAQDINVKIAIVDFDKFFQGSEAGRNIQIQMKEISQGLQSKFQQTETELRQAQQDLINKQALLSPEAFQEERRKFDQRVIQSKKEVQQKTQELQRAQARADAQLKRKLSEIILNYASQNGYGLILKRSQTVIVADKLDITDQIIAELNRQLPAVKVEMGQ